MLLPPWSQTASSCTWMRSLLPFWSPRVSSQPSSQSHPSTVLLCLDLQWLSVWVWPLYLSDLSSYSSPLHLLCISYRNLISVSQTHPADSLLRILGLTIFFLPVSFFTLSYFSSLNVINTWITWHHIFIWELCPPTRMWALWGQELCLFSPLLCSQCSE